MGSLGFVIDLILTGPQSGPVVDSATNINEQKFRKPQSPDAVRACTGIIYIHFSVALREAIPTK